MARTKTKRASDSSTTWDESVIRTLLPWRVEIVGFLLLLLAAASFLGSLGLLQSSLLDWWVGWWHLLAGWGRYPRYLMLAGVGLWLMLRRVELPYKVQATQAVGLELMLLSALALTYQLTDGTLPDVFRGQAGGLVGWALAAPLLDLLGGLLAGSFFILLFLWGAALVASVSWTDLSGGLRRVSALLGEWAQKVEPPPRPVRPSRRPDPVIIDRTPAPAQVVPPGTLDPRLPPIDLLEKGTVITLSDKELNRKKAIIEQTLVDFGLRGEVTEIRRGPTVTQFGVTPGYLESTGPDGQPLQKKVRVSRIAALRKDLALALAVSRLRIEAPVPGRGVVGLEVPNAQINIVRIRTVLESPAFKRASGPLAVALGQGVSGAPLALDLAKMPHLLIAGTTGSGKSVLLNAFVTCLVFNNTPEQLRLVMIDPKKVELIRFNGLPHMLGNVEVEHDRVTGVLRWLIAEMERRYEAFAHLGAKNLDVYNQKVSRRSDTRPLPYIVVFIDELADLMAAYTDEVEQALCRLAQMARATGIHLVVATQRPSTDVLTGLIKANFPARIAFSVASGTDSRVILDAVGAEQLLGRGDMLFLSPDSGEPMRIQGCFAGDNEIERLVTHWQRVMPETEREEAPWERLLARQEVIADTDDMLEEAIELAQKSDTISTSLIQRRLRVGFPRAARLMEALYELDLVEDPKEGGRTRRTFVDEEDDPLEEYLAERGEE